MKFFRDKMRRYAASKFTYEDRVEASMQFLNSKEKRGGEWGVTANISWDRYDLSLKVTFPVTIEDDYMIFDSDSKIKVEGVPGGKLDEFVKTFLVNIVATHERALKKQVQGR